MANIQQSLNQMLYQAGIGLGLYKQTPEYKERAELKQEEKKEAIYERTLKDYEETHQYLSPEELPKKNEKERQVVEEAVEGLYNIAEAKYQRDPTPENWEKRYLAGVSADEIRKEGGTSSYIAKLKKNYEERTSNLQSQKQEIKSRRQFLENPEQTPWQANAFIGRQAEESRIMSHNKPNAFIEQQNRELEEMRNGK